MGVKLSRVDQEREQQGVAAIIFLQRMAGIEEPPEKARKGWRAMSAGQQNYTLAFHKRMAGKEVKIQHDGKRRNSP